jgi:(2Fe-2S) ferredoxin
VIFAGTPLRGLAVAELVRRAACEAGAGKRVEGRYAAVLDGGRRALEDPRAWSEVPSHERHVLVCTGPRCTARGAGRLWRHLRRELRERRLEDGGGGAGRALVAQTGCLYPCNLGPTMVVYPEGVWYGVSGPRAVERIVEDHLVGGGVAGAYALSTGCCGEGEESGSGVFQRTFGEVAR